MVKYRAKVDIFLYGHWLNANSQGNNKGKATIKEYENRARLSNDFPEKKLNAKHPFKRYNWGNNYHDREGGR